MRIKCDFVTNSSTTAFILHSVTTIELLNTYVDQEEHLTLIYKEIEDTIIRNFECIINKLHNGIVIKIDGIYEQDYGPKRDVTSTGKNLKCIQKCLNQINKKIQLPEYFPIHFQQDVECIGDGWDGGDYKFAGQGYIFNGDTGWAHQMLDIDRDLQCEKDEKGKIFIDFPKILMRLGH